MCNYLQRLFLPPTVVTAALLLLTGCSLLDVSPIQQERHENIRQLIVYLSSLVESADGGKIWHEYWAAGYAVLSMQPAEIDGALKELRTHCDESLMNERCVTRRSAGRRVDDKNFAVVLSMSTAFLDTADKSEQTAKAWPTELAPDWLAPMARLDSK